MKERPALWHSRLSHHLGPLHSILTPVLLLIGSNVSGVTMYVDFSKWPHETTLRHKLSMLGMILPFSLCLEQRHRLGRKQPSCTHGTISIKSKVMCKDSEYKKPEAQLRLCCCCTSPIFRSFFEGLLTYLLIVFHLLGRVKVRKRETHSHPLYHSPNTCNSQG